MLVPMGPAREHTAGAHGRRALVRDLEARALRAGRDGGHVVLVLADLNDFRRYNATHGQSAGDALLDEVAVLLSEESAERVYRHGSDSFGVVFDGPDLAALWPRVARALSPVAAGDPIACAFGVAISGPAAADASTLLTLAEDRLEDQKTRNPVAADRLAELLLTMVRAHQPELGEHSRGVSELAERLAMRLGLPADERAEIRRAADLHDVGKLCVDTAILAKPGALDDDEWREIRRHTVLGEQLLAAVELLRPAGALVRASHERWDGRGYPDGLAGADVPLGARVVAACDAYDAMTSDRPYREARDERWACEELAREAGAQFDPDVVAALLRELDDGGVRPLTRPDREDAAATGPLARFARLHSLLDEASAIEEAADLSGALDTIARSVAETLGFGAVVINLYRPEWDDFIAGTVFAPEAVRSSLLGSTYGWDTWEQLLDERFHRDGAYLVYQGSHDWENQPGKRVVIDLDVADAPDAWMPEDEIFVPFHHSDGELLGIFNVGAPASGRRPTAEELEVLVLVSRHAARAVQRAQQAVALGAHRRALEGLLRISSQLSQTVSPDAVLAAICRGISEALGFGRVVVQLPDPASGLLRPAAVAGAAADDPAVHLDLRLDQLAPLFDPEFEREGCYLLSLVDAERRLGKVDRAISSTRNGRGPRAWNRHWLVVPLVDHAGERVGAVIADDPADRLLPGQGRLQALRLFANQATIALDSAHQYERMRALAERDALTQLLNRHAFMRDLASAVERGQLLGEPVSLVYCDLDGFKAINDARGHEVGDRVLAEFGRKLSESVDRPDAVYRIGGDEFAILLGGADRPRAVAVADRAEALCRHRGELRASFGVSALEPGDLADPSALLRRADEAMYAAKRARSLLRAVA